MKIGKYSGSERLDPSTLEEPDSDNEFTRDMWFNEVPNDPDFLGEINERVDLWKKAIAMTMDHQKLDIHMVGESHIDVAWKWRYEQTRKKAIITFRKAVFHAKKFPGRYSFAISEPLLLDWVKQDNPELFKEIQETVKNGGIELVGGSYVEPDCMMPSGEAFVRERLYGQRFYKNYFGRLADVEWFLDSFGYNRGLPQILAKSGAKAFWTSKITWNRQTVFPFVNFWWQGPDGTRLLTSNFHMGMGSLDKWVMYEIGRHPLKKDGRKVWDYTMNYEEIDEHVEEDEICPVIGCFFGKGDGGHGPTHQEVTEANGYEDVGFAHWSHVGTFYDKILEWGDRIPVWNDELYLEYHRGTFSVHSEVKRHNRLYENSLTAIETLALITSLSNENYSYPFDKIEDRWKTLLKNQFHDVLPGSSIPEVYDDVYDDWVETDKILCELKKNIGKSLGDAGSEEKNTDANSVTNTDSIDLILYNSVSWKRNSPVFIPVDVMNTNGNQKYPADKKPNYAKLTLFTEQKSEFICQPVAADPKDSAYPKPAGWWVVVELNGVSSCPAKLTILNEDESNSLSKEEGTISGSDTTIRNENIHVKVVKETGAILELDVNGINDGKNLLNGNKSNLTLGFLDDYPSDHAWNIKPEYWKYPLNDIKNDENVKIEITEKGPIFATLSISRTLGKENSPVTQKITIFKDVPEIYMEWASNWKQTFVMLKVLYSTNTNAEIVTSDEAYCAIERKTNPETPCDKARYEKICHKYFDLSTPENTWGLALLNEGKYAFDAFGSDMRLTMLRVPRYTTAAGEAWVNKERKISKEKYGTTVPEFSGLGPEKCRYALLPHTGGTLLNADGTPNNFIKRHAEEFNQPIMVIPVKNVQMKSDILGLSGKSLCKINSPNVFLGALKLNEWEKSGSIILRVVEGCGLPLKTEIQINPALAQKIKSVNAVDLLERKIDSKFTWDQKSGKLSFDIGKFEICTFELIL